MLMCVCLRILASSKIPRYDLGRQTPHFWGGSVTVGIRARFGVKHTRKHLKSVTTLSVRNAFYVSSSIIFHWSMPVILSYVKIPRLLILSLGESYLSILKLQTAEALGIYSIWSISHLFMGFFYSQSHHPWLSRQARFDVHAYCTS
jgi:hypothetical protein